MRQAPLSFSTLLFLGAAIFFACTGVFLTGAGLFAWLAMIQLLNLIAPKTPFPRLIHWIYAMTFEVISLITVIVLRLIPITQKPVPSHKNLKGPDPSFPAQLCARPKQLDASCQRAPRFAGQKNLGANPFKNLSGQVLAGDKCPILLVHGYLHQGSVWFLFKKRLKNLGFGPIYTINLGYPFQSIRTYAKKVEEKAKQIASETNNTQLVLIGHSMGGLVSALYATKLAAPNTIPYLITMGSPFHGTPVAKIGIGINAREMETDSTLLKEIREAIRDNKGTKFFHLATKSDEFVIPGTSAILAENPHLIFEDLGHTSLLYARRSSDQISIWLKSSSVKK